jgi:hypothetical protein
MTEAAVPPPAGGHARRRGSRSNAITTSSGTRPVDGRRSLPPRARRAALLAAVVAALSALAAGALAAAPGAKFLADGDGALWPAPGGAPDGSAKLGLNVPYSEQYLEQLRGPHRGADPAVVDKLLRAQQLWRRAATPPPPPGAAAGEGAEGGGTTKYSLLDATPMFVHTKSWVDVLRRISLKMYVSHAVCLDYPACTTTAPLAHVETPGPTAPLDDTPAGARLAMIVQCGLRVFRGDAGEWVQGGQVLELIASTAGAACSNAAPRARNFEGGALRYFVTDAGGGSHNVSVWAAASEAQLRDGLLVSNNDLWATMRVQPLRLLNANPGTDYWTRVLVPLKGGLNLRMAAGQVAAALDAAATEQQDVKALWIVTPRVRFLLWEGGQVHGVETDGVLM